MLLFLRLRARMEYIQALVVVDDVESTQPPVH